MVKIQAEITMAERLLLDIDQRRVGLEAEVNALRDRPPSTAVLPPLLPTGAAIELDYRRLSETARRVRPEVLAAEARIEV